MRRIAALLAIALLLASASTTAAAGPTRVQVVGQLLGGDRIVLNAVELPSGDVVGQLVERSVRGSLRATVDCIEIAQTDQFTVATMSGLVVGGDLTTAGSNFFFVVRVGRTTSDADAASSVVLDVPSSRPCLRDFTGSDFPVNPLESGRITVTTP